MVNAVEQFIDMIKQDNEKPNNTYSAVVTRIDNEGVIWVQVAGSDKETPTASASSEVKQGDSVNVHWRNNKLYIAGNYSDPAAGTIRVDAVEQATNVVKSLAETAMSDAETARIAADNAVAEAGRAKDAADRAETSANEANTQATYATNYANNALTQLSTVESVVDALTWISEHSVFVPTADTTVQTSKLYYIPNNNVLTLTSGTTVQDGVTFVVDAETGKVTANGTANATIIFPLGIPDVEDGTTIYFSGVSGGSASTYGLRYRNGPASVEIYDGTGKAIANSTSTILANKSLNVFIASNTTVDNVVFTPTVAYGSAGFDFEIVQNPTGNPSAQGWYELSTDEAVKTYVQTHLALTNDGLYVLNDASAYKMLLANDGMYIQAPNGQTVNQNTAYGTLIKSTDGTTLATMGYGPSVGSSGNSENPYYTFGIRRIISEYSTTSSYAVGDLCYRTSTSHGKEYKLLYACKTAISSGEAWNSSHWYSLGTAEYGAYSVAEGKGNIVTGYLSHVEGENNIVTGKHAHIEGMQNKDTNSSYSTVTSDYNHIEGSSNYLYSFGATNSHIEGEQNRIGAADYVPTNVHVHGKGNLGGANCQTVIGKYNTSKQGDYDNPYGDTAFIIGNGTADNARSNALTVDWNGNVNIASGAKYKINGTNLAASDVSAVALADKYTRSSAGSLDWTNQTEGDAKVIAKSALAFWNGAYSGNNSNLSKCSAGTIIGSNNVTTSAEASKIPQITSGSVIELPYIMDLHNSTLDYDVRVQTTTTGTKGEGTLNIRCGKLQFKGTDSDYITSQGTSSGWRYRKWYSGKIEAWAYDLSLGSQTPSVWVSPVRYKDITVTIPSGIFSAVPTITATGTNNQWGVFSATASSATSVSMRFITCASAASTVKVNIYAVQN